MLLFPICSFPHRSLALGPLQMCHRGLSGCHPLTDWGRGGREGEQGVRAGWPPLAQGRDVLGSHWVPLPDYRPWALTLQSAGDLSCQEELWIWGGWVPLASRLAPRGLVAPLAHRVQGQTFTFLHLASQVLGVGGGRRRGPQIQALNLVSEQAARTGTTGPHVTPRARPLYLHPLPH